MKLGAFLIVAAFTAAALAIGTGEVAAQDMNLSVATNAEPDVLDATKSGSPQFFTTLQNVYEGWGIGLAFYGKNPAALYSDPELERLFDKAEATFNPAEQAPLIKGIMSLEQKDLYIITLWDYVGVYAMKKNISDTPGHHGLEIAYLPWVHESK